MPEKTHIEPKPQEREFIGEYSENGKNYKVYRFRAARQSVIGEEGVFEVVYEMNDKGWWKQKPFGQCEIMGEYQEKNVPMRVVRFEKQFDTGILLHGTAEEVAENKPRETEKSVHMFEAVQKKEGDKWVIVGEEDLTLRKEKTHNERSGQTT